MNLLTLLLTTLTLLPTLSYTQESSSSSSSSDEDTSSTSSFTVTAYRSNSPINNLALTIFSGRFYLGGRTSSYCPPGVASEGECPPGNETIIIGDNGLVCSSPLIPLIPTHHTNNPPPGTSTTSPSPSPAANKSTSSQPAPSPSQPHTQPTCPQVPQPAHSATRPVHPTAAGTTPALRAGSLLVL